METEGDAASGRESAKRRRAEGNSSGKIDDESATTEEIPEVEKASWADIVDPELSEEENMIDYRRRWESSWTAHCGSFEQETTLSSMVTTHEYHKNMCAFTETALQVYSIKVEVAELTWPLQVYGIVAARDAVDQRRNVLFNRERDNCQIITKNDPSLLLTGPSRAIVFLDPIEFEINLKVKGESEDKETLIHQTYTLYNGTVGSSPMSCSNELCKISFNSMELRHTVQATIISVQIIRGSWPSLFAGEVFCHDGSSLEKVVLLDFPDGMNPPVDQDGNLALSRRVVSVNEHKEMKVSVCAYSVAGDSKVCIGLGVVSFKAGRSGIADGECDLDGQYQLKIKVAWSLLVVC